MYNKLIYIYVKKIEIAQKWCLNTKPLSQGISNCIS